MEQHKNWLKMSSKSQKFFPEKDKHLQHLMTLSNFVWENKLSKTIIDRWLDNFDLDHEKIMALELLSKFLYFNEKEMLRLCQISFQQLLVKISQIYGERVSIDLENLKQKYLRSCRFFGMGTGLSSGGHFGYLFRQYNDVPTSICPETFDDIDSTVDFVIFVDDVVGTGEQTIDFWNNVFKPIFSKKNIQVFYLVFVAYKYGKEEIEKETEIELIPCHLLDDQYRIFSNSSYIFPDEKTRSEFRDMSKKYGERIWRDWPLGYLNFSGLVGLHNNIPDTTLPIIWGKNGWFPIFKRHIKI